MAIYNIYYILDGGTNNPNNPSTYDTDQLPLAILPATKSGFTFNGRSDTGRGTGDINYTIEPGTTGSIMLYAFYIPAKYKVLHVRERQDRPGSYSLHETEDKYGIPGEYTNAQPKVYSGMVCVGNTAAQDGTIDQAIIAADGNTYVRIFYNWVTSSGAIMINGQALAKRYINGQQVQKIMLDGTQIRQPS